METPRNGLNLRKIDAFAGVWAPILAELEQRCLWLDVEEGEMLSAAGDRPDRILFLIYGEIGFPLYTRAGKFVPLPTLAKASLVDASALVDEFLLPYSIEAVRPSLVASIAARTFAGFLERDPALRGAVARMMMERQRMLVRHIVEISTMNVRTRIRNELARLCVRDADGHTGVIFPVPTQAELANRIGTQREVISRELSQLQHEKLIARRDGALIVRDIAALLEEVELDH